MDRGTPHHRGRAHAILFAQYALVFLGCACSPAWEPESLAWRPMNFREAGWKHDDVFFIDPDTGWVVANTEGEIHKTEDGGHSWRLQFAPASRPYFRCVAFVDEKVGFACNLTAKEHGDPLYRTRDGGATWSVVEMDGGVEGLCGVSIVDAKTITATGKYWGPAHFAKSSDGGDTWSVTALAPLLHQAVDLHFWNEREGVLLGGSEGGGGSRVVVLGTTDGGETWTERYRGPRDGEWGWKLSFPSREVGYASVDTEALAPDAVDAAYFLKTRDGGWTWERKPFYRGQYRAQGIGFISEEEGWMGSFLEDRPWMATTDGGESWKAIGPGDRINRFRFTRGIGFAAGHRLYRLDKTATPTPTPKRHPGLPPGD